MENVFHIIQRPVVTERATSLKALANQYGFRVAPEATKHQIKFAIERLFKVKVKGVNTMQVRGKARRMGAAPAGSRAHWKKAIVTLVQGQELKLLEETQ
jgi:large subunit ribosomal protein L23